MVTISESQQLEIDSMAAIGQCASLLEKALTNGSSFKIDDLDTALLMIGNMVKKRIGNESK